MSKPKHRRCQTCDVVTSRYVRTERAGAVVLHVWASDPVNGEVRTQYGRDIRCRAHGAAQPVA